jgi:hypothetical protein
MTDHTAWKRDTAIRHIEEARRQSIATSITRLMFEAAAHVGAPASEVERWWNGRGR